MPLFKYRCEDCSKQKEHFVYLFDKKKMTCPNCGSERYVKCVNRTKMNVEYSDNTEYMENSVQPHVNELYEKMGREALDQDTKTAEDLFGSDAVEDTIAKDDE